MATSSRRPEALQRPHNKHYQRRAQHQQQPLQLNHQQSANIKNINPATGGLDATSVAAKHAHVIATQIRTRNSQNHTQQTSPPRMKRPLDPIANNYDLSKAKKARITVEILARPIVPASPPKSITVKPQHPQHPQHPLSNPTVATAPKSPPPAPLPSAPLQELSKTATATEPSLKKYKEKAINGIKHELDRLQPNAAEASSATERPGRKLRSQEATRFKSELSAYFPDYDEVIGNDPKEQHILNLDTPIVLVDSNPLPNSVQSQSLLQPLIPPLDTVSDPSKQPHQHTVRTYGDDLFTDLYDSQRIDFAFLSNGKEVKDPLPDTYYEPTHRKAERLEKSIRNTEKGRAQHEKDQIIRLLNELQGHDWLRTMGVSGVTESRKKTFEPARDHFIRGCQAILEKFRIWSQEEKKRKLMKERALAEEAEESEERATDEDDEEQLDEEENSDGDEDMGDAEAEYNFPDGISDGDPPDYSDVDASARQLLTEAALAREKYNATSSKKSRGGEPPPKSPEPYVTKEFTSFFDKKHQRDAALSKSRRRGRTVVAWGHPVPDMMEDDFELPEEYRDTEILKAHERQKRRDRRQRQH